MKHRVHFFILSAFIKTFTLLGTYWSRRPWPVGRDDIRWIPHSNRKGWSDPWDPTSIPTSWDGSPSFELSDSLDRLFYGSQDLVIHYLTTENVKKKVSLFLIFESETDLFYHLFFISFVRGSGSRFYHNHLDRIYKKLNQTIALSR